MPTESESTEKTEMKSHTIVPFHRGEEIQLSNIYKAAGSSRKHPTNYIPRKGFTLSIRKQNHWWEEHICEDCGRLKRGLQQLQTLTNKTTIKSPQFLINIHEPEQRTRLKNVYFCAFGHMTNHQVIWT